MLQQKIDHYWQDPMFEEGYFTYPNLYTYAVNRFPSGSHFVEIGAWKGRSSVFMGVEIHNSGKTIKFDCVDTWKGSETENDHQTDEYVKEGKLFEKFTANIGRVSHVITPIVSDSVSASEKYTDDSLDFVFIDGDHRYEYVLADIKAWLPKVKQGGMLAGHDYGWCEDVRKAVHEILGEGEGKFKDNYGVGYSSYSDPWNEGCWMVNIS